MFLKDAPRAAKRYLNKHTRSLLKIIRSLFSDELSDPEGLEERLPLIKWKVERASETFYVYFLSYSKNNRKTVLFFEEMISHWLFPKEPVKILSSRNLEFDLPASNKQLFFVELLVQASSQATVLESLRNLPVLAEEIKLGALSSGHEKGIMEMKQLSLTGNTFFIYQAMLHLSSRYPKRFGKDVIREVQHFLIHAKDEFQQIRSVRHLCRILCTHYFFQRALIQDVKMFPYRRHLYLRLMKTELSYPFGSAKVLSLSIGLNSLGDYESFEKKHILKAAQRVIPHVQIHKESYLVNRRDEGDILSVYLEIEKTKGGDFTLDEIKKLKNELPGELKNSVEHLSPALFIPRNEEELMRNIIHLSHELRYVRDLPQAMISFHEQNQDFLKFNIVLLRLLKKAVPPLHELSHLLPSSIRFIHERSAHLGFLRKKYLKEANIFALEIESHLFLRKNHSVDLVRARQAIVAALQGMIGPFRDYNGGFLLKQNEQLEAIKETLSPQAKKNEFLLENLFYSLTPTVMQTCIPPKDGMLLCTLVQECFEKEIPYNTCAIYTKHCPTSCSVVIKTTQHAIKESLLSAIKSLNIDLLKLASAVVDMEGFVYFCYLYLNPGQAELETFLRVLEEATHALKEKKQNLQVLKLSLPRAAQSLDPRVAGDRLSGVVINMLFEGLMRFSPSGSIEPAICDHMHVSQDKLTYHFHLKKTQWSNGLPLTAHDFAHTWKNILEPDFFFPYSYLFFPIKNAEAAKKGSKSINEVGISVIDPYTFKVELEYPTPYFLELTASWLYSPLCKEIDQKHPGWAYRSADTYVCNGPFELDTWHFNDDLQLIKNPYYWDAASVKLDRIQLKVIEDEARVFEMFKEGEIDWIGDPFNKISPKAVLELREKKRLINSEQYGLFWLQVNQKRLPFKTAKMRRAFACGLNRQTLIDNVLRSDDLPALGLFPPYVAKDASLLQDGDQKTALRLFEEGLKELKTTRKEMHPLVISHSDIEEQEAIMREVGRQWKELFEIEIKYERHPWHHFFDVLNRGDFMVGGLVWYPRYSNPSYYFNLCAVREQMVCVTNWKDNRYYSLVEKANREADPKKQYNLLVKAERLLLEEMPVIPLFHQKFRFAKNAKLEDVTLTNVNQISFERAVISS